MTKFKEWTLDDTTAIDVLVGGTPCQSFSVAGLRKGLEDPRGNLMLTYLAIANKYRPKWLVWENVPGVLSSNGGNDFASFLRGLGELGYGFAYRILDAQYFGVAQRRRRVFVVGYLGDWHRAAAVLFEQHSLSGHPAPSRQAREGVAKCITTGVGKRYDAETDTMIPTAVNWDGQQTSQTLTNRLYGGMGAQQMPDKGNLGAVLVGKDVAMQVRRLTPVECERLQGFPDNYTDISWRNKPESPDGPRYKALGNSMAVPVMRWIGERINEVSKL